MKSGLAASQALSHVGAYPSRALRRRFFDEEMDVFGHDDVAREAESRLHTHFAENS